MPLDWDGQNPARKQAEAAIREILDLDIGAIDAAAKRFGGITTPSSIPRCSPPRRQSPRAGEGEPASVATHIVES